MKRLRFRFGLAAMCATLTFIAGCHRGSVTPISIKVDPSTAQSLDAGHSESFSATLGGDINNKGVKWTLTQNGNACSTGTGAGCGTLSNATVTSVTYTAPPNVSGQETITLTATSLADPVITANVTITIEIPPQFPGTVTIPTSAMNGVPYSASITATGGVVPLTYSIINTTSTTCGVGGNLPCGLVLNPQSGTISGTPTFDGPGASQTSTFTIQVTDFNGAQAAQAVTLAITVAAAPALSGSPSLPQGFIGGRYSGAIASNGGVPPLIFALTAGSLPAGLTLNTTGGQITGVPTQAGTSSFTVTITDSALPTHQTANVAASITVSQPPTLTITTSSLQNGTAGAGYGALLQASGGIPPYTWTLVSGQLPAGLSLLTQNDSTGLISGTPILGGTTTVPDTSTFTVSVTDSNTTPATATIPLSIAVVSGTTLNRLFSGTYTFLFQGWDSGGPMAVAGTLTADGNGNITAGYETSNRSSGVVEDVAVTGTYAVGLNNADGRGTMHLAATPSVPNSLIVDYQLTLESDGTIQMIENNDTNSNTDGANNTHGSGVLKPVSTGSFSVSNLSGNYAFELFGADYGGKPMGMGGVLHGDGQSKLSPIVGDLNDNGSEAVMQSPTGNFAYAAKTSRGASTLLYELSGKSQTQLQFAFYFVSSTDIFFVETDIPTITDQFPRLSGEAVLQQTGTSFGTTSLAGSSVVTGTGLSGNNASVFAGLLTAPVCDGVTSDTSFSYDQDAGGTTASVVAPTTTCSVASNGRVTFSSIDPRLAVAYLTGPGQGFILGSDAAVTTGMMELQTGSNFSVATVDGSYALSDAARAGDTTTKSTLGQVISTGNSNLTGVLDDVEPPGKPANLGQSFNMTVETASPNGRGTMASNSAAGFPSFLVYYMVAPGEIRLIPFDSTAHPYVIFLNH